ncbi:hypothetical protein OsJ_05940 [Oryza sativa Japonica Group]|uniref:Uncharacterized protein n=1 Tax=Oryza sativa subsp. japonica TaxID=39947 RepID=B9F4C6_ORYSJ|nr:hypothetical protein OsJ_05940 [Oryza sativa Japonica Group]
MPMERSVSCAERPPAAFGGGAAADLRCYSASYATSYSPFEDPSPAEKTRRRGRWRGDVGVVGGAAVGEPERVSPTGSFAGAVVDDAELQRRKRLVAYKAYDVEGKVKDSVRRSVKWIKGKCSRAVDGKW